MESWHLDARFMQTSSRKMTVKIEEIERASQSSIHFVELLDNHIHIQSSSVDTQ